MNTPKSDIDFVRITFRVPCHLLNHLKKHATRNFRSVNNEMVHRLESTRKRDMNPTTEEGQQP
ncbi:Arc family DNA-binding protein [Pseudorhodoferax soli]|uniref:Arc family DNA-binding protein n=1 Tax=Pseudorhodoferax soli TaxID=545864 RepID=UPI001476041B